MPLFDWIRSDLHSLNLDWIISKIKTVEESEQGAVDAAADAKSSKTAAAASATAANNSKTAAAGSATAAAGSAAQAQALVDQLDTTIAQDVSDWLDEHITPTTPAVDDTLTVSGAAADAAVTGDKITSLKTEITNDIGFVGGLLGFWNAEYKTVNGTSHSSNEQLITCNIPAGTVIKMLIAFDQDSTSVVAPKFYYSDGTSVSKASVTVNGEYEYTETKDVIGFGFYSGATLPTGTVTIFVYTSASPTEVLKNINTGAGLLAVYCDVGMDADAFDKNMTVYSFGTSNKPSNIPNSVNVGNLLNLRGDSATGRAAQILFDSQTNEMYFRAKSSGVWTAWNGTTTNRIILKKTGADTFSIYVPNENGNVVRYDYIHRVKTWETLSYLDGNGQTQTATDVLSCDVWNNYYIYNNDSNTYIAQGHSNFIVNINDDVDKYCGDGHGNEVIILYDVIADGAEIDISSMAVNASVSCSSLRLVTRSNVYKVGGAGANNNYADSYPLLDTSGNPVIALFHYMEMLYEIGNKVTINNKIVVKQNDMVFNECHGAMLECQFTDFAKVMCNNDENTMNEVSDSGMFTVPTGSMKNLANTAQNCNTVEMYGDSFYIRQTMKNDDLSDDTTNVVYFNKYTDRLKCYFQPVKTVNRSIAGVTPDTFNTGDVISVTDERVISI